MHETTFNRRGFLQVAAMTVVGSQLGAATAASAQPAPDEADKGGHVAAWEQPQLFCTEVRAGFRSLRT